MAAMSMKEPETARRTSSSELKSSAVETVNNQGSHVLSDGNKVPCDINTVDI